MSTKFIPFHSNIYFIPSDRITRLKNELEDLKFRRDSNSVKRARKLARLIARLESREDN